MVEYLGSVDIIVQRSAMRALEQLVIIDNYHNHYHRKYLVLQFSLHLPVISHFEYVQYEFNVEYMKRCCIPLYISVINFSDNEGLHVFEVL